MARPKHHNTNKRKTNVSSESGGHASSTHSSCNKRLSELDLEEFCNQQAKYHAKAKGEPFVHYKKGGGKAAKKAEKKALKKLRKAAKNEASKMEEASKDEEPNKMEEASKDEEPNKMEDAAEAVERVKKAAKGVKKAAKGTNK